MAAMVFWTDAAFLALRFFCLRLVGVVSEGVASKVVVVVVVVVVFVGEFVGEFVGKLAAAVNECAWAPSSAARSRSLRNGFLSPKGGDC